MLYKNYKDKFEKILSLACEIEQICKDENYDNIDEPFSEMNKLYQELDIPKNLSEEELKYILQIRDKIEEKNKFIVNSFQKRKIEINNKLLEIKKENKIIDAYKIPEGIAKSTIFDSLE